MASTKTTKEEPGSGPARALSQPTPTCAALRAGPSPSRRLHGASVDVLRRGALAGIARTRGPQLKASLRAREKIAMDRGGDATTYETLGASRLRDGGRVRGRSATSSRPETAGTVRVVQVELLLDAPAQKLTFVSVCGPRSPKTLPWQVGTPTGPRRNSLARRGDNVPTGIITLIRHAGGGTESKL